MKRNYTPIGCYTMDLYCDSKEHYSFRNCMDNGYEQFTGRTEAECLKQAKKAGWYIDFSRPSRTGGCFALCPKHSKKQTSTKYLKKEQ